MANAIRIEFMTREFRYEHGGEPRGRGFWCFQFEGHEFWTSGTYTEAKKACMEEIKRLAPEGYTGIVFVKVMA